ncbi:MAG: peptide deformylase [bacterium]
MFVPYKIVNEKTASLHEKSELVKTPISLEDTKLAVSLFNHVLKSQNKDFATLHNIRPGVGLACPQVGINKRMFAIHAYDEDDVLGLAIINPKIVSTNKELIYLNGGEGCLSVDRPTTGVTPRYSKITVEGFVFDFDKQVFNKKKFVLKDYFAIVFQHEYDHLDGILYTDKLMDEDEAKSKGILSLWEEDEEEEEN